MAVIEIDVGGRILAVYRVGAVAVCGWSRRTRRRRPSNLRGRRAWEHSVCAEHVILHLGVPGPGRRVPRSSPDETTCGDTCLRASPSTTPFGDETVQVLEVASRSASTILCMSSARPITPTYVVCVCYFVCI